ncbi:MAG: Fe-S cluster assembly protein SufD [Bacteroidota bacterium]
MSISISTTTQDMALEARFLDAFHVNDGQMLNGQNDRLKDLRREAIRHFEALGFPALKAEAWKYTKIRKVLQHEFGIDLAPATEGVTAADVEAARIPGLEDAYVFVLVNGRFREDLSSLDGLPEGVVLTGFQHAASHHPELVNAHLAHYADFQDDAFVALNTAFITDGLFLHVPKNTVVERPIQVVNLLHTDHDLFIQPRKLIVAERSSQVTVVETFGGLTDAATFTKSVTEFFVASNAHVKHYQIQEEGTAASTVGLIRGYQQGDSTFSTTTVTFDGATIRNNISLLPDGQHCNTNMYGLFLGRGRLHVDNHTFMDHAQPQCESNELYKGILDDRATGVFNGKIFVRQDAQQTNAYQSNKSIVLSDTARMYSKPELEIYADDVRCSHGATTGQLDEEGVFYLRARGLTERQARALMLLAFARDVLDTVELEPLHDYLDVRVSDRIQEGV